MKRIVIGLVCFSFPFFAWSQSYIGNTLDNYSGVHSLLVNPANVAGSKTKIEFNILSASAFVGNDYLSLDFNDLTRIEDGFDFDSDVDKSPTDRNNFFGNVDILGPSFMFRLNEKSGLSINTRVRAFFNIHNISGILFENISEGFEGQSDFQSQVKDLSGTVHAWGEVGLTYGRVVLEDEFRRLKVGTTLKYLAGSGGLFASSPQLGVNYNAAMYTLTTSGTLNYGYTAGFESDDITFSDVTGGIGADLGVVFEMRENNYNLTDSIYLSKPYKFRFGLSLVDLGAIKYQGNTEFSYNMNATIDASQFDEKDLATVLEDNYEGTEVVGDGSIQLPTSLQVFADYHIKKKLFVSLHGAFSMRNPEAFKANSAINTLTISPRLETKTFSLYSPISLRQYQSGILWGLGLRFGPLMLGSGSLLSNLISTSSRSTDVYLGLKIPIHGRVKMKMENGG